MSLLVAAVLAVLPAPVTLQGVGGVVPGMTPARVAAAWGVPIRLQTLPGSSCGTSAVKRGTVEGYAIFENRRFGAVFFFGGPVRTGTGIRLGSTMADLRRAYGTRLKIQADHYVPKQKNVYVGDKWKIRFDVSPKGRVITIAFGARPVTYIEGCA